MDEALAPGAGQREGLGSNPSGVKEIFQSGRV